MRIYVIPAYLKDCERTKLAIKKKKKITKIPTAELFRGGTKNISRYLSRYLSSATALVQAEGREKEIERL